MMVIGSAAMLVIATGGIGGRLVGRGERVRIDALQALDDPDAAVARLRELGIDARIFSIPIGPANRGVWVDVGYDMPNPTTQGAYYVTSWGQRITSIPKGINGTINLFVGRKPERGEIPAPDFLGNDLGPTGDFWCLALEEMNPAEARRILQDLGYEVAWEWRLPINEEGVGDAWMIDELPESATLVRAIRTHPSDHVVFQLMDERFAEEARKSWGTASEAVPRSDWASWAPPCD